MSLSIELNRSAKRSIYRQIAEQIKTQISNGRLPAGTRLPTVRKLASDTGVTRLTIQSAYGELQADGWIESVVGRGTFVSDQVQPQTLHSSIGHCLTSDGILSDMFEVNTVVGVRSMAIAEPDSDLFPVDEFWASLTRLRPKAAELFGYTPPQGDPELRVEVSRLLSDLKIETTPDDVLITAGVMHGLTLATQALTKPGDAVLIEQPTFIGYLNILRAQGLRPLTIPIDDEGPDLDLLHHYMATEKPSVYYTIPNFHNPTGLVWSMERRRAILELANRYNCQIVEDDVYGLVSFEGAPLPTLMSLDRHDRVIYLSGFSKALMPGLRIGYMVVPERYKESLLRLRRSSDLCGAGLTQRALAHFVREGGLKRHLRRIIPVYRQRRNSILSALNRYMPPAVTWSRPLGGYSVWLKLPRYFPPGELYRLALQQGFAFTAGEAYEMEDDQFDYFRLCFGNQTEEGIWAGVRLLSEIIRAGEKDMGRA